MTRNKNRFTPLGQIKLKELGYKLTTPREIILDLLNKTSEHLSAEEIYHEVSRICPHIGLATVYRTLELLVRIGLVFKFDFGDGRARYELKEGPEGPRPHHHLVCTYCNRVIDYTGSVNEVIELRKRIEKGLSKKYHFKILNHFFRFDGLCEGCQKKKEGESNKHDSHQTELQKGKNE